MSGNKEQQLTFELGITNVPSDATCDDNTLEACVGLTYADGEHRVIQKPSWEFTLSSGHRLMYVHHTPSGHENKITYYDSGVYSNETTKLMSSSTVVKVESNGRTLIVLDGSGLHYFLWKQNSDSTWSYSTLNQLPPIDIEFSLQSFGYPCVSQYTPFQTEHTDELIVYSRRETEGIVDVRSTRSIGVMTGKQEDYNNMMIGMYAENKKKIAEKKGFCLPFFARAALEMYDGSYSHISNPVLLLPTCTSNSWAAYCDLSYTSVRPYEGQLFLNTMGLRLRYKLNNDYSAYSDLVRNVVIFVSRGIEIYDLITDQPDSLTPAKDNFKVILNGIFSQNSPSSTYQDSFHQNELVSKTEDGTDCISAVYDSPLKKRQKSEIDEDISNASVFYKLCKIGLSPTTIHQSTTGLFASTVLPNLEEQEQLKIDDYYSNSQLIPSTIGTYNSRLILANLQRGIFDGYHFFTPYAAGDRTTHYFKVEIDTESGTKTAYHTVESDTNQMLWFYYPDPRAKRAWVNGHLLTLKEHTGLNGAYFFGGVPESTPSVWSGSDSGQTSGPEHLPNIIALSEANNPFTFLATGYYTLGAGKIIGFSTLTQALSQGQFGQYPLIAFTTEGVWAMSVANSGYFSAAYPMSREVANEQHPCIIQTDGAIYFASEKGLMVVLGNEVKCVSEQLSGKANGSNLCGVSFATFLKNAFIAYDYRDSLLWIFNHQSGFGETCWVYNIKSGTFAQYEFSGAVDRVVNNYPDYLLQAGTQVYSLMERPNINADTDPYQATMTSRPMKLENALALKSIMQMRNIKDMEGTLTVTIKAANDLAGQWTTLTSLRGRPWKYYKMKYDFANLKATDRFAGTVIITQERRTNKLR